MPPRLADGLITAQERLRALLTRLVGTAWEVLPGYDEENVEQWLTWVVPLALAGTHRSAALTDAYLARALDREPLGLEAPYPRPVEPAEVYRRPFVTVWTALQAGTGWADAVHAGRARAEATAAMDVQMASRATFAAAQQQDPAIRGWQRAVDGDPCDFCADLDGVFVKSADALGLHNNCGCTLEPVLEDVDPSPIPETVAVHEHGELGLVIGSPDHDFTAQADL